MENDLDDKVARLDAYIGEIQKDVKNRVAVVDKILRDVSFKVDVLERRADVQRRIDSVQLRDKAHKINDKILALLDGDNPDVTSAAKLFIIKNILETPLDLENPQVWKSLSAAARSLGNDNPLPISSNNDFQV